MYIQRYDERFHAAGAKSIFGSCWYNRLGVERVMGFVKDEQYKRFLELCPQIERYIVDGGIMLIKIWLFFFSSRRRHTRCLSDWSSDVCSSDLDGRTVYLVQSARAVRGGFAFTF